MDRVEVEEYFSPDLPLRTRVWLSDRAAEGIADGPDPGYFLEKLEMWARNGFVLYEGGEGYPIKHEWRQVFRVGKKNKFRLIGFYHGPNRAEFIGMDAFVKKKEKLNASERLRIDRVADIRDAGA